MNNVFIIRQHYFEPFLDLISNGACQQVMETCLVRKMQGQTERHIYLLVRHTLYKPSSQTPFQLSLLNVILQPHVIFNNGYNYKYIVSVRHGKDLTYFRVSGCFYF